MYRFMALADLMADIQRSGDQFGLDDATEHSTVETMLSLMNDLNGEVKNMAVKAWVDFSLCSSTEKLYFYSFCLWGNNFWLDEL